MTCKELKIQTVHKVTFTHPRSKHLRITRIRKPTVQTLCARKTKQNFVLQLEKMDARTAYETFLRKRVSDSHWSSVKRTLTDSGMEVDSDTVVFFAKLRKEIPRAPVGILQVFECYQKAEKLLAINSSKITGSQILDILICNDLQY